MKQQFKAQLIPRGPAGAWTFLPIPQAIARIYKTKARIPVRGAINGFPFRTSLLPEGDGTHAMPVNKEMLKGARTAPGEIVTVVMELDTAPRTIEVPEDMMQILAAKKAVWEGLSPSKQKEFVEWIEQAKRPETRAKRLQSMLALLAEGRTPKG